MRYIACDGQIHMAASATRRCRPTCRRRSPTRSAACTGTAPEQLSRELREPPVRRDHSGRTPRVPATRWRTSRRSAVRPARPPPRARRRGPARLRPAAGIDGSRGRGIGARRRPEVRSGGGSTDYRDAAPRRVQPRQGVEPFEPPRPPVWVFLALVARSAARVRGCGSGAPGRSVLAPRPDGASSGTTCRFPDLSFRCGVFRRRFPPFTRELGSAFISLVHDPPADPNRAGGGVAVTRRRQPTKGRCSVRRLWKRALSVGLATGAAAASLLVVAAPVAHDDTHRRDRGVRGLTPPKT